jgi:hypothetical protein
VPNAHDDGLPLRLAKRLVRLVPASVRKRVEERFSYAVGHATRITNDGYPQPDGAIPPAGKGEEHEAPSG